MGFGFRFQKEHDSKIRENKLVKILNFKDDFNFDDILPYEDTEYNDQYDDVIVGGISKFDDDFFKDDIIYYFD
ncbi:hypothetical protein [Romboutsia sp.]|uniref:hypothetical protein n=1 Tax=Romboutsia sp. TaxID=1965302 RepID=UPI003F362065